jgi:large subunit ribosomal protein L4
MKLDVVNAENKSVGSIELADSVFGLNPIRQDILAQVVHWQLAKRRAGTHAVKERGDVSGSTRKLGKQKGGGRARHGAIRAAQFRGGGIIFGPVVRDHGYSLNKKSRSLGLRMALSAKTATQSITILDSVPSLQKTREAISVLSRLGTQDVMIITGTRENCDALRRVMGNIPHVDVLPVEGANVYSILRRKHLVLDKAAAEQLQGRLQCA